MKLETFLNKKIVISQVKSESKLTQKQKGNLVGLGLRGIGSSSTLDCSQATLGMIKKINHIIKITLA